jgi:class 3 adenylate cyclase
MPAQHEIQAVMFADVSGSSRLYKQQGNAQAKRLIDQTLAVIRSAIECHKGVVVKTIGDEIMARFARGEAACQCALELQRQSLTLNLQSLRIGIAYGDTLLDPDGDVFGDVVNEAAEVAHIARARQILITRALWQQLNPSTAQLCDTFDRVVLKGAQSSSTLYRLHWESTTASQSATAVMDVQALHQKLEQYRLRLTAPDHQASFTPDQLPLVFGRESRQADWPMHSTRVSREHARLVFRRGKYVLIDHSTNGTYLHVNGQDKPLYLRREEIPLTGSGRISFGGPLDTPDSYTLCFQVG